nr:MAG TPA: hypothetical protein [Caudoviricetes sp.]
MILGKMILMIIFFLLNLKLFFVYVRCFMLLT